jgi:predicted dienelactone hydrolase
VGVAGFSLGGYPARALLGARSAVCAEVAADAVAFFRAQLRR